MTKRTNMTPLTPSAAMSERRSGWPLVAVGTAVVAMWYGIDPDTMRATTAEIVDVAISTATPLVDTAWENFNQL